MANITAIIPAAGQGRRMQSDINKQYLLLKGKPVLAHTLAVFEKSTLISEILVVVREEEMEFCKTQIVDKYAISKVRAILPGGKERVDSVKVGLDNCSPDTDIVVVHDGARPLLTYKLLNQVLEKALETGAAIAAVPVKDCIKRVADDVVAETLDRQQLRAVQTPQAFKFELIRNAFNQPLPEVVYDDAMMLELCGYRVSVVPGSYKNLKITTPEDLQIAAALLENEQ